MEAEEEEVAEVAVEEDSLLEVEVVEVAVVDSLLVEGVVVEEEEVAEAEGDAVVAGGWVEGRKLSLSLTDTPGSSLPGGRRTLW